MNDRPEDPRVILRLHANHLNSINRKRMFSKVFYEVMSGGLVWTDETKSNTPTDAIQALRFLFAYRTSVMVGNPREELKRMWDESQLLFPDWIGFRSERRTATPRLLKILQHGEDDLKASLRNLEDDTE